MKVTDFFKTIVRFLYRKTTKEKKCMKACQIYKTDNKLKIVTMYKTDAGLYLSDEPIFILPVNSSKEELLNAILQAISASKLIKHPSDYSSESLLRKLKEKSFKSLYLSSVLCILYIDGNNAEIELWQYSKKLKYLVTDESHKVHIENFTKENLIMEISKILELGITGTGT